MSKINNLMVTKKDLERNKDVNYAEELKAKHERESNPVTEARIKSVIYRNASIAVNCFSVLTAMGAIAYVIDFFSFAGKIFAVIFMTSILVGIELGKRHLIPNGFQGSAFSVIFALLLSSASMSISYLGGNTWTTELATPPPIEKNPKIDSLNQEIINLDKDIDLWENQTWRGKIVREARKGKKDLESLKIALINQRMALEEEDRVKNRDIKHYHKSKITSLGFVTASIAAGMDVFLWVFLWLMYSTERDAKLAMGLLSSRSPKSGGSTPSSRYKGHTPKPKGPKAPPHAKPASYSSGNYSLEDLEYKRRTGRQISDLNKKIEELKKENEELKERLILKEASGEKPKKKSSAAKTTRCVQCGKDFSAKRSTAKYCSDKCKSKYRRS